MPRRTDSAHLDLHEVFRRVQQKLLADCAVAHSFEHPTANGTANENVWLNLFANYLPKRYRAAPAFIINASGRRSRQIDIAIFDNHHSPMLFPHTSGDHIPIESVCAVFEVKPSISKQWLRDAGAKAASVRALQSPERTGRSSRCACENKRTGRSCRCARENTTRQILAGLLAETSIWKPEAFSTNVARALDCLPAAHSVQYGCALAHGAFENLDNLTTAPAEQALIFFLLRLIRQLNALGPTPEPDLLAYLNEGRRGS